MTLIDIIVQHFSELFRTSPNNLNWSNFDKFFRCAPTSRWPSSTSSARTPGAPWRATSRPTRRCWRTRSWWTPWSAWSSAITSRWGKTVKLKKKRRDKKLVGSFFFFFFQVIYVIVWLFCHFCYWNYTFVFPVVFCIWYGVNVIKTSPCLQPYRVEWC